MAKETIEEHHQPLISRRMLLRFAIGLFALAALFFGYQWWRSYSQDPDLPAKADTKGMIAALLLHEDGAQAVVFEANGELRKSPGYTPGANDKELVWRPDGNRLFFMSDREDQAFHVYRWNLASDAVMRRSFGTRSQSSPTFAPIGAAGANDTALLTSGGFVVEFDPVHSAIRQVLPPVGRERAESDEGAASQFDAIYQKIGTSFRYARWGKDKESVVAVMRREDDTEILVVQDMTEAKPPAAIIAGDRVEFDISPETGVVAFSVTGFTFHDPAQIPPEAIENGRVKAPFHSVIGLFMPDGSLIPVINSPDPAVGFRHLRVAPDGENALFVATQRDANGNYEPMDLAVLPLRANGGADLKRLLSGKIYEPSWHPNSHMIVFVRSEGEKTRQIYTINKDGSGLSDVSKGSGEFASPMFSPQSR
jgi:hypothetical protein